MAEKQWVRNQKSAGSVVGRIPGEYEGKPRDMLVVQTFKGVVLVPDGSTIPIDAEYMVRQAGLDLEGVISAMLEVGLTLDQAQAAWDRAMAYHRKIAADIPQQTESTS